jgi:AcrR family transcriptional regulator
MTELEKGPRGLRRGRGARERILAASQQLFRDQGINGTGLDQLCAVAQVSKRTFYQHFTGKDELIAEHLRRFDPDILPEVFDREDLAPRDKLLAIFDIHAPLCPFIAAAVEIHDPSHPARLHASDYKKAFAARLTEAARQAGAADPERRLSPQPRPRRRYLRDRRRHRRRTHRQRHSRGSGPVVKYAHRLTSPP